MKRLVSLFAVFALVFVMAGCWQAEIKVDTTINGDGSGTRSFIVRVYDDSLSTDPIINPDDPDQSEGKGPVINDKHIVGGVEAIQDWLEANAPTWMTVEDMGTEGVQRIFTLTYEFEDFEDFLAKYEELVDLSPTLSWSDFDEEELPMWECEGTFKKTCNFEESAALVQASLDWAIAGIWNDIYDEADLAGYVDKDSIAVLADYVLDVNGVKVEELSEYDPEAADGEGFGATVYVDPESVYTATTETGCGAALGTGSVIVMVLASIGGLFFIKKRRA